MMYQYILNIFLINTNHGLFQFYHMYVYIVFNHAML